MIELLPWGHINLNFCVEICVVVIMYNCICALYLYEYRKRFFLEIIVVLCVCVMCMRARNSFIFGAHLNRRRYVSLFNPKPSRCPPFWMSWIQVKSTSVSWFSQLTLLWDIFGTASENVGKLSTKRSRLTIWGFTWAHSWFEIDAKGVCNLAWIWRGDDARCTRTYPISLTTTNQLKFPSTNHKHNGKHIE